jgi:hypothetical protein
MPFHTLPDGRERTPATELDAPGLEVSLITDPAFQANTIHPTANSRKLARFRSLAASTIVA